MVPAHQRLDADDMVVRRAHHWLVVDLELVLLQRVVEVFLEQAAVGSGLEQVRAEEAEPAAPAALGSIERKVGVAHEAVAVITVERRNRDADRRADEAAAAINRVRLRNAG
jgi:hypothetical protein